MTENRKDRTKLRLRNAMIQLLREKPFDKITTTELVKCAKISRSSFYTHYQDKYDMIDHYQKIFFNTIQYIFDKNNGDVHATILEAYTLLNNNEIYAVLLSENGSQDIHQFLISKFKNLLENAFVVKNPRRKGLGKVELSYVTTFLANAIFGFTQAWLRRNKKETPEQMTELLMMLIN